VKRRDVRRERIWFRPATKLNALDPATGKTVRSIDVPPQAHAGTAFESEQHLYHDRPESRIQKIDAKNRPRARDESPRRPAAATRAFAWAKARFG